MSDELMSSRELTEAERGLLRELVVRWLGRLPEWLQTVRAVQMDDSGMGSLQLILPGQTTSRGLLYVASECRFWDRDGVEVIASLFVGRDGLPYELDLWRVDFKPLIEIPLHEWPS